MQYILIVCQQTNPSSISQHVTHTFLGQAGDPNGETYVQFGKLQRGAGKETPEKRPLIQFITLNAIQFSQFWAPNHFSVLLLSLKFRITHLSVDTPDYIFIFKNEVGGKYKKCKWRITEFMRCVI